MPDTNDMDLVREFARDNSEAAFTELVRRHLNLVYSVARRYTGNDGDAHDVTQAVFIILARKAAGLREKTLLTGWLYETTRFAAARLLRTNARRQQREQEAYMQSTLNEAETANIWTQLAPHLETAMGKLSAADRALLVLRFYENKSGPEAAALLGIPENTAHKRVTRAIEKLRKFFVKRGVTISGEAIAGAVSANSVQAAPVALVKTISAVAIAKGAAATTSTLTLVKGALKIMAWTKAKMAIVGAVVVGMATFSAVQYQAQVKLREQNQTLQQQQSALTEQIGQLQRERDNATNRLASLADEMKSNNTELLKLRGEVAQMRTMQQQLAQLKSAGDMNDPFTQSILALATRAAELNSRLQQMPDKGIPELQWLDENDWLKAAQSATNLDTDVGVRQALNQLRRLANYQVGTQLANALRQYISQNNGQLPANVSELQSYFKQPMDSAVLQRYQMIQPSGNGQWVIEETAPPVDNEYDNHLYIGSNGTVGVYSIDAGKLDPGDPDQNWATAAIK